MNKKIISLHIENDIANQNPMIIYTDEDNQEWVYEEQPSNFSGYITALVKKEESWYFKLKKQQP